MKKLLKIEEAVIAIGLLVVTALLFVNIVLRYGFAANTTWAQEFIRYVMVWITFIGASVCFQKGMHLGVDFVMDLLKGKAKKGLQLFINIASIVFMGILIKYSLDLVLFTKDTGQITPSLQIPLYYIYLAIPIGAALSVLHLIFNLMEIIQNKQSFTENAEE